MNHVARSRIATLLLIALATAATAAPREESRDNRETGWLGVMLGRADEVVEGDGARLGGVEVIGVVKGSPAERAGLRAQDRIVAVGGEAVTSSGRLIRTVGAQPPGRWVSFTIERGGKEREITARLAPRPDGVADLDVRVGWIGIRTIDLPPALRQHFGVDESAGVMIAEVDPLSPAEAAGFELGDVLFEVNGEPVGSMGVLRAQIATAGVGNRLELTVMRDGSEIVLEATVAEMPESAQE